MGYYRRKWKMSQYIVNTADWADKALKTASAQIMQRLFFEIHPPFSFRMTCGIIYRHVNYFLFVAFALVVFLLAGFLLVVFALVVFLLAGFLLVAFALVVFFFLFPPRTIFAQEISPFLSIK